MSCDASGAAYSIPAFRTFFLSTLVWSRGFCSSLSSLRWRCRWTHHGWTLGRKIYQGQQPEDDLKTRQSCQTITVTFNHPVNRLKIGNAYRENQRRQDQRDFFAPACTVRNSKVIIVWCFGGQVCLNECFDPHLNRLHALCAESGTENIIKKQKFHHGKCFIFMNDISFTAYHQCELSLTTTSPMLAWQHPQRCNWNFLIMTKINKLTSVGVKVS